MSVFRVGQKVVCIDDAPSASGVVSPFKNGDVLTIISIMDGFSYRGHDLGLLFAEVPCIGHYDHGYSVARFRPVVERKTDISIFRAMLNTTPQMEGAKC